MPDPKDVKLFAKRRRLAEMSKSSYVSMSGLASVLASAKREGLPEAFSRTTQWRSRKEICQMVTPYGPLVEMSKGNEQVAVINPHAIVYEACLESPEFSKLIRHSVSPGAVCNIVLYSDGVSPSDGLNKFDSRKSVAV